MISPIMWKNDQVVMIDQRKLPWQEEWLHCQNYREVARCIKQMVIRGAPAIGIAAAMGLALGALKIRTRELDSFYRRLKKIKDYLAGQRPTVPTS